MSNTYALVALGRIESLARTLEDLGKEPDDALLGALDHMSRAEKLEFIHAAIQTRHALEEWERQKVRNDDSLVLELRWRDVSIVLTGDVGGEARDGPERRLGGKRQDTETERE